MFITQEVGGNTENDISVGSILCDEADFQSPCVSVVNLQEAMYSDISDDEGDFQIPSSQMSVMGEPKETR